ncbi:MAG: hypothetical protein ACRD2J_07590 [Thermoanaerobaculia bacterium]
MRPRSLPRFPFPLLLALPILLTCTTVPPAGPGPQTYAEPTTELLGYPEEVIVLVETAGNTFRARPNRAVLTDPSQRITWVALDPDVKLEIDWKNPTSVPPPPAKPCLTPARICGGMSVNRPAGTRERHRYSIRGTKAGSALDPLDPEVIIFY